MFNWKPQAHSGWHGSRHRAHTLTPRNILIDMALVCAAILILLMMWKVLPSRAAGFADLFRIATGSDRSAAPDRVSAAKPIQPSTDAASLLAMTYDRSANVRAGAVTALAEHGAIETLPRFQELQVVDGNENVQEAAYRAEDLFRAHVATLLHLPVESIKFLVAAESGNAYAVSDEYLFALRDGEWRLVSHLPDAPNGIATAPDGQTLYLATPSNGLWRSLDAGETWKHVQFGLRTPTQLTVTAVTVNPEQPGQAFIALAAPGSQPGQKNPLGIFVSNDAGESWRFLPDSPVNAITTRLVIHRPWTGFLYGVADGTPWRYALPIEAM